LLTETLEIVLTPKVLGATEIGGPRLKPFCLMVNLRLGDRNLKISAKKADFLVVSTKNQISPLLGPFGKTEKLLEKIH